MSSPNGKEPAPAFSTVTNTMSECSPNDRPMSEGSHLDETNPIPAAESPVSETESAYEISDGEDEEESEGTSGKFEEGSEEEEESSETENLTKELNESDEEPPPPPRRLAMTPPRAPTAIYCHKTDKFIQRDEATGAIIFWRNTAPMRKDGRLFLPRWTSVTHDEGNPSPWLPRELEEGNADGMKMDEFNKAVQKAAEEAVDCERVRVVHEYDPPWPHLTFARVNDLDRSLCDTATRLIVQATETHLTERQTENVDFEKQRAEKTKDFIADVGRNGVAIGEEFALVADEFAAIASILQVVRDIEKDPDNNLTPTQKDMEATKEQLQAQCHTLKKRLERLKEQIRGFGGIVKGHIQDFDKDDRDSRENEEADQLAKRHPIAFNQVKMLQKDIETDISNDKSGVFQRWYEQSRLHRVLNGIEESAAKGIKEDIEKELEAAAADHTLTKFGSKLKPRMKIEEVDEALRRGTFPENYIVDEPKSDEAKAADDEDELDLYKCPDKGFYDAISANAEPPDGMGRRKVEKRAEPRDRYAGGNHGQDAGGLYSTKEPPIDP